MTKLTDLTALTASASDDLVLINDTSAASGSQSKKITVENFFHVPAVGTENVLLGSAGSASRTTGSGNTSLGYRALEGLIIGNSNTCIGNKAGLSLTGNGGDGNASAALNTLIGSEAGGNLATGSSNVMVGQKAGVDGVTASAMVCVGKSAGSAIAAAANSCVYIGQACGEFADTTGQFNIAMGVAAAQYLSSTAASNVYVGRLAGAATNANKNTGSQNVGVGARALLVNTTATQNTAIGFESLRADTTGGSNTSIGYQAGASIVSGINNVFIGAQAGFNHTGSRCIFIGAGAGNSVPVSSQNICVIGGAGNERIDDVYFGKGYSDSTPTAYTINGTGGSGTDIAGADLQLAGGRGTGSGAAGKVSVRVAPAGSTGTSLNSLVTVGQWDASTTAGYTRLLVWDVSAAALVRVSVGASDSGGTGFKVLRVPN